MEQASGYPLQDRVVIVTRPEDQAEALAAPLRAFGAKVAIVPALEIQPPLDNSALEKAVANLDQFDWLICTSVNGADALGREARRQDVSLMRRMNFAGVGQATADRMTLYGAPARYFSEDFSASDLGRRIAEETNRKRVLLVQGVSASNELAETLVAAGASVDRVDAYRAGIPHTLEKRLRLFFFEYKKADAVTFTSAQTALNFHRALERCQLTLSRETVIASIGPTTSAALRRMGRPPDVQAPIARMESLAAALSEFFVRRG